MTKKLRIKQDKWLRAGIGGGLVSPSYDGEGQRVVREGKSDESCLLAPANGRMCCLGFAAKKAGLTNAEIKGKDTPAALKGKIRAKMKRVFPWLYDDAYNNSETANVLMGVNDDKYMTLTQKKKIIKETFAEHDWEVEFDV